MWVPLAVYLLATEIADQENDNLEDRLKFQLKFNVDADNHSLGISGSAGADSTLCGLMSRFRNPIQVLMQLLGVATPLSVAAFAI